MKPNRFRQMRDLRFRAWNAQTKTMIQLDPREWPLCALEDGPDWKVMQFTGLLDKDGRAIFEGDILAWLSNELRMKVVYVDDLGAFMACTLDYLNREYLHSFLREQIEIIGNIYENPELLDGARE